MRGSTRSVRATERPARHADGAAWSGQAVLLAYAAYGDPTHPVVTRMLQQHMLIRSDADRVANAPSAELLHDLGELLADHVQLEERELFPLIEQTVPEPALHALGDRLRRLTT